MLRRKPVILERNILIGVQILLIAVCEVLQVLVSMIYLYDYDKTSQNHEKQIQNLVIVDALMRSARLLILVYIICLYASLLIYFVKLKKSLMARENVSINRYTLAFIVAVQILSFLYGFCLFFCTLTQCVHTLQSLRQALEPASEHAHG